MGSPPRRCPQQQQSSRAARRRSIVVDPSEVRCDDARARMLAPPVGHQEAGSQCCVALDAPEHDAPRGSGPGRPPQMAASLSVSLLSPLPLVVSTEKRELTNHLVANAVPLCICEPIAPSSRPSRSLQCLAERLDPPHASSRLHAPRRWRFVEPAHTFDST